MEAIDAKHRATDLGEKFTSQKKNIKGIGKNKLQGDLKLFVQTRKKQLMGGDKGEQQSMKTLVLCPRIPASPLGGGERGCSAWGPVGRGRTWCLAPSGRLVILLLYGSSHHNKSQSALGRTASPAMLKTQGD